LLAGHRANGRPAVGCRDGQIRRLRVDGCREGRSASDVAFAAERTPGITFESCASANYAFGSKVEVVSEREWKTQEEAERFYNERLDIEVHQTTDKNAPLFAEAGVNGHMVWFPRGVRVNGISAGPIKTLAASGIKDFGKILNFVKENAPLRRNVTLEDVGNASAFLLSDLAGGITGEITYVDGGFSQVVAGMGSDD
jgi:hypothetical protein